jgi:hypothetical protein
VHVILSLCHGVVESPANIVEWGAEDAQRFLASGGGGDTARHEVLGLRVDERVELGVGVGACARAG